MNKKGKHTSVSMHACRHIYPKMVCAFWMNNNVPKLSIHGLFGKACSYNYWCKLLWSQSLTYLAKLILKQSSNTHCLDSQAECSNASSAAPTFSLNKSTCFLNCDMASNGAEAWKLRRQICRIQHHWWSKTTLYWYMILQVLNFMILMRQCFAGFNFCDFNK